MAGNERQHSVYCSHASIFRGHAPVFGFDVEVLLDEHWCEPATHRLGIGDANILITTDIDADASTESAADGLDHNAVSNCFAAVTAPSAGWTTMPRGGTGPVVQEEPLGQVPVMHNGGTDRGFVEGRPVDQQLTVSCGDGLIEDRSII